MIGKTLGSYRISDKIGEGGMGEVYRATDAKLKRDVAIKVLPRGFLEDPDRLERFEREAQLLAQLQHPHIASIYGLEEADGVRALVMELVEGPTLADRLEQGALTIDECLSIARQISDALEEAHEKGIVHRDLKPQNIKAPVDGKVKVLDFGLAKALDPAAAASNPGVPAASPTLTLRATVQGMILGTAAYMAPEQAAGGVVDRRADIWSFGVVLYEMLVGRRLFEGETVSHVLAGVLKDEPDFDLLPDDVPPRVRRLVRRCLRKKPRERLQAIGDARVLLDEVLAGEDRAETAAFPPAPAFAPTPKKKSWIPLALVGAAALALGVAAGVLLLGSREATAEPLRIALPMPEGTNVSVLQGQPSLGLSADGRKVALAVIGEEGGDGIVVRDLGRFEPRRLDDTSDARAPFFSPDGAWIGYFNNTEMLKVATDGGKPIRLAPVDERSRGAVWGKDGYIYFAPETSSGIRRISEAGGAVEPVTELDLDRNERTHRWPDLSPDGEVLIYTSDTEATPTYYDDARIEAMRLDEGTPHVLVEESSYARWLADDLLVYANGGNLFAVEIDRKALTPRGNPVNLEQEVATGVGSGGVQLSVSRNGAAAWFAGDLYGAIKAPNWYDLKGNPTPSGIPELVDFWQIELSPDGKRVAVRTGGPAASTGQSQDIWVGDLERGTLTRLTFDEFANAPTWSPDGKRIAYQGRVVNESGVVEREGEIVWKPADGSGEAEVLLSEPGKEFTPASFSPDGKWLLFTVWDDKNDNDLWLLPVDPRGEPQPFQATAFDDYAAQVSPDGRWVAFGSNESGRYEVYVRPFPEGAGKWQISPDGGYEPRWSPTGERLFYRSSDGRMSVVQIEAQQSFRASTPESLWSAGNLLGGRTPKSYGISPDGRRFLALSLFEGAVSLPVVNYTDGWIPRARSMLDRGKTR